MGLSAGAVYGCKDLSLFYRLTLEIIFWNFKALFRGCRWPSAWKAASPHAMKTQLRQGKSTNHRHRLDIFVHPCSFGNCSFQPRPMADHHSVFLIIEPQGSLCLVSGPFTQTFCFLLAQSQPNWLVRMHGSSLGKNENYIGPSANCFTQWVSVMWSSRPRRFLRVLVTTLRRRVISSK